MMLKKIYAVSAAVLTSAVMMCNSVCLPAYAVGDNTDGGGKTPLTGELLIYEEAENITDGDHDIDEYKAVNSSPEADSEEIAFLNKVKGNRWGYKDLANRSKPEERMALYNELYDKCVEKWCDTGEYNFTTTSSGKTILFRIDVSDSSLTTNEAAEVLSVFCNDNPVFYFLMTAVSYSFRNSQFVSFNPITDPKYLDPESRAEYQKKIKEYCEASAQLVSRDKTCYDNALALHDMICRDMDYAYDENHNPSMESIAHNVVGGIVYGEGVCESYSKVYELVLNYNKMENIYVVGTLDGAGHGWNMLRFDDGEYYFVDVTNDDGGWGTHYFAGGSRTFGDGYAIYTPESTGLYFLYDLPELPANDFSLDIYFSAIQTTLDLDNNGVLNNRDIKALQQMLVSPSDAVLPPDLNFDGKRNNRDLKEFQYILIRFNNR